MLFFFIHTLDRTLYNSFYAVQRFFSYIYAVAILSLVLVRETGISRQCCSIVFLICYDAYFNYPVGLLILVCRGGTGHVRTLKT